ncbi:hypothetical protein GCM10007973_18860 [Polymorphobacter multimanifer]|uniref:Ice-binding protein C-terminal domain-containing protein n=1 Tax=Polymorphobacter multimanifer TaxID=1070431 RepID=A0A841L2X1_9SPHN|nr:PEPxxWA-CTERM sorting domain-containing protein [Polymorphobacter multimanifer]MBB6226954.1 hypothetical protein [Polymorphobacter multimanifer]GGI82641.1 hypothetical protein GCM10007973_18860 [Polymorphobacter multimanifer]
MRINFAGGALALLLLSAAVPASSATLTFDAVGTLNNYVEDGFTVNAVSGVVTYNSYGNPGGSLYAQSAGAFDITGGYFTLDSFDGGSGSATRQTQNFTVTGYLGNAQAYVSNFTRVGTAGFRTFYNPGSAIVVDRLVFGISNTGFSVNVDNININSAAAPVVPGVPEPASWAMMLLGFGATGFAMRRRGRDLRTAVRA